MGAGAGSSDGGKRVAVGDEAVGLDSGSRSSVSVKVTGVTLGANVTGRCCGCCCCGCCWPYTPGLAGVTVSMGELGTRTGRSDGATYRLHGRISVAYEWIVGWAFWVSIYRLGGREKEQ